MTTTSRVQYNIPGLHRQFSHAVTVVAILLLVALVEGYKTMDLCHLDSYTVTMHYWVPSRCPYSDCVVAY